MNYRLEAMFVVDAESAEEAENMLAEMIDNADDLRRLVTEVGPAWQVQS